jgi:hypothetical protein
MQYNCSARLEEQGQEGNEDSHEGREGDGGGRVTVDQSGFAENGILRNACNLDSGASDVGGLRWGIPDPLEQAGIAGLVCRESDLGGVISIAGYVGRGANSDGVGWVSVVGKTPGDWTTMVGSDLPTDSHGFAAKRPKHEAKQLVPISALDGLIPR